MDHHNWDAGVFHTQGDIRKQDTIISKGMQYAS